MNTTVPPSTHQVTDLLPSESVVRVHSTGGLGLAGFFGGPLAISYLIYRDLVALGRRDLVPKAAAWFAPCLLLWIYCVLSFPPDLISQWIPYLPQAILWWLIARHVLGGIQARFVANGGLFKSRWQAVRFGFFVFLGLKIAFFAVGLLQELSVK